MMTSNKPYCGASLIVLAGMALMASAASAQDGSSRTTRAQTADDIIVTARLRSETLLDVPVSISALSPDDLQRNNATNLTKIGELIPHVTMTSGGSGTGGRFTIRGIGSSSQDAGVEQTVSINIDGIQVSRGRAVMQSFFDIEQVEVLKGPQALFFGKNSPGGVISVRTAGPTDSYEGYVKAGYEFEAKERFVEGAFGGPISDTLGFRLAVRASKMDGWIDNVAPARENLFDPQFPLPAGNAKQPASKGYAGRLTVVWEPTDNFDLTGKFFVNYDKTNAASYSEVICADPNALPTTFGVPDIYGDCKFDGTRSSTNAPTNPELLGPWKGAPEDGKHYARFKGFYGSVTANYRSDNLAFTSITGIYDYKVNTWDNFDYTSLGFVQSVNDDAHRSISQEVRLLSDFDFPVNFVAGALYEHTKRTQDTNGRIAPLGPDPRNQKYHTWERPASNKGDTYSAFGQLILSLRDDLELAGGVRFTHEKKSVHMLHTYLHQYLPPGILLAEGVLVDGKYSDSNWSPEATLTWHPTPNTTLYAAYKTGYKSGGFSNPSAMSADFDDIDNARFGSETAKGGEVGAKGSFADGLITLTAAAYRYEFTGLQLTSFNAETTTFTIRNAAKARVTGFEVEANVQVTPSLRIHNAIGYNEARYLDFAGAPCYAGQTEALGCVGGTQDLSGTALVHAPDWSLITGFVYDQPIGERLAIRLTGDTKFTDDYFTQENQNPIAVQKSFWLFNASASVRDIDDRWELALIGKNLANRRYRTESADKPLGQPGEISAGPSRGREVMLQGTIRF